MVDWSDGITIAGLYRDTVLLSSFIDELPVAVIFLSEDRKVVYQNRAAQALTGYPSDEARGLSCAHVVRGNLCGGQCPIVVGLGDEDSISLEGDVISHDRRKIPVRITFARVKNADGGTTGYFEIVENLEGAADRAETRIHPFSMGDIIGRSPTMERLFAMLPGIAQTDSSVLITGETGTGKDLLAEVIHKMSNRAKGPFVKVNCGALPETLLESELFGHVKGAFTGANQNKPGRFRLAHNGSLFLTEIGDLPLSLQVKLLTFLDDHVIYPLGSGSGVRVNVRIIAATHRDLAKMVQDGKFREDLLFRLNVVRLHIPPLREREGDIHILLDYFLRTFASRFGKKVSRFSPEAMQMLIGYSYPGNVRELKNIVEYAINVCTGTSIGMEHIPGYVVDAVSTWSDQEEKKAVDYGTTDSRDISIGDGVGYERLPWEEVERRMILDALIKCSGRKSRAAKTLGWGRATLWRKMKQYGIS